MGIFKFKVPYYVGPLNCNSQFAWIQRKADGKIFPWNFEDKVDFDASEQAFIQRMTNQCTYLPEESVLPKQSLYYQKFMVLNEINNIKIDENNVPNKEKENEIINVTSLICGIPAMRIVINNKRLETSDEDDSLENIISLMEEFISYFNYS